ncbi:uncharacterized small protein (DUF1192 family) [Constrictibacter sp. MBR-5]|uniref:DUF1192 domain-containing protein n=1 Tax=Constrictibacter sp. MBR-5 TaxID=3156467 RepID=UPI00339642F6
MQIEDEPPKPRGRVVGADLSPLSIGDLHAYVADLEAEIVRVRAEIEVKGAARGGAEALFGRKD